MRPFGGRAVSLLGVLLLFAALLAPSWVRAEIDGDDDPETPATRAQAQALLPAAAGFDPLTTAPDPSVEQVSVDGPVSAPGLDEACDAPEQSSVSELVDCGAEWSQSLDEPALVSLLRRVLLEGTPEQCTELLTELWERESCQVGGTECGKLIAGGLPGPAPKLANASTGDTFLAQLSAPIPGARRLPLPADASFRALLTPTPPSPPPRS